MGTIRFPGSPLPLRIFEPRRVDVVSDYKFLDDTPGALPVEFRDFDTGSTP